MLGASRLAYLAKAAVAAGPVGFRPVGITANGDVQHTVSEKFFGPSSIIFDGTGDWLQTNQVSDGISGDFTIEFFFNTDTTSNDGVLIHNHTSWAAGAFTMYFSSTSNLKLSINGMTDINTTNINTGTWYHMAVVRSGSTVTVYKDGASQGSQTYTGTLFENQQNLYIGTFSPLANVDNYDGYLDEIRLSDNARYTSGFSQPTRRFVNDSNTLFLLHGDAANATTTFEDDYYTLTFASDSYSANVEVVAPFAQQSYMYDWSASVRGSGNYAISAHDGNNHTLSTTQKKWSSGPDYVYSLESTLGGQSTYYDLGTSMPAASSGTYVVEGWFYANNSTTNANWCLSSGDSGGRWLFGINNGTTFTFGNENNISIGSGWHHLAIVCDSGTKRFYYDGIYKGAWVSSNGGFSRIHLGSFNLGDSNDFRGHVQDFRVTVGSNRGYTGTNSGSANFTLPTQFITGDGT